MNRKEFIKTGGRLFILGGIAISGGYLVVNKKVTASCNVSPVCDNCGKYSACDLQQAKDWRDGKK